MPNLSIWFACRGDPARLFAKDLQAALEEAGLETSPAGGSAEDGPGLLCFDHVDAELLAEVRRATRAGRPLFAVSVPGAPALGEATWELLGAGATDVFAWDGVPNPSKLVAARLDRWRKIDRLLRSPAVRGKLIGESAALGRVLRQVVEVARFTTSAVLITGESGTGKELVARLIHELDGRPKRGDLVIVDCTTVVPELSGSEFFGHERGAFTQAVSARDGAFALADGGTLFLDEVGELPLPLQAQLLRVVQEKTFKRVGGNRWFQADFRLICATNRIMTAEVAAGTFRRDLYYRIAAWCCHLPSLAERRQDLPALTRHFLAAELGGEPPVIDPTLLALLEARDFPGNVRELKQLVARIAARSVKGGPITLGDLPEEERPSEGRALGSWPDPALEHSLRRAVAMGVGLEAIGNAAKELAVEIAVGSEDGNLQRAARRLGVTDRALQLRRRKRRD